MNDKIAALYKYLISASPAERVNMLDSLPPETISQLNLDSNLLPIDYLGQVGTDTAVQAGTSKLGKGALANFAPTLLKIRNKFGPGKSLGGANLNLSLKSANNLLKDVGQTRFGGVKLGNIGLGLYGGKQALDLINEGNNVASSYTDLNNLKDDVITSAYSNPLANNYLTSEQQRTLRQVKNGSFDQQNPLGNAAGGIVENVPEALKSALIGYLVSGGNPVGAIVGGGSALAKGGMKGVTQANQNKASKLQALYSTLSDAERDYNSMRRPSNLRAAGLSSRAYAGLY